MGHYKRLHRREGIQMENVFKKVMPFKFQSHWRKLILLSSRYEWIFSQFYEQITKTATLFEETRQDSQEKTDSDN